MSYNTWNLSKVQCWLLANDRTCWDGSQLFPFLFFSLGQYFTCNDSDQVWITCESELHGWESRMACSILSPIGSSDPGIVRSVCSQFWSFNVTTVWLSLLQFDAVWFIDFPEKKIDLWVQWIRDSCIVFNFWYPRSRFMLETWSWCY